MRFPFFLPVRLTVSTPITFNQLVDFHELRTSKIDAKLTPVDVGA
jgi:hypothetical protein